MKEQVFQRIVKSIVKALAVVQMGSFMNMVIGNEWGKIKTRYIDLAKARKEE
jgi:hypothetical protein